MEMSGYLLNVSKSNDLSMEMVYQDEETKTQRREPDNI